MRITTLGACAGGVPYPGGGGTSFLFQTNEKTFLVDFGNDTLTNLPRYVNYEEPEYILMSHLHYDHCLDIFPFLLVRNRTVNVIGPEGTKNTLRKLFELLSSSPNMFYNKLIIEEINPEKIYQIGNVKVRFSKVIHNLPSYAMRIESKNKVIVYSSDTGWCDSLIESSKNADILICEATWQNEHSTPENLKYHLNAEQAGKIAAMANVKHLVLTHIKYDLNFEKSIEESKKFFSGSVTIASENKRIDI